MSEFVLHPKFVADTSFAADWPLSRVLLMEEGRYFWLVLVPRLTVPSAIGAKAGDKDWPVTEITHLSPADRAQLMEETARAGKIVAATPGVAKLNIGSLGNLVPQLHMHVVGRAPGDLAWPGPMWGHSPRIRYEAAPRAARLEEFRALSERFGFD